jgi:BASS family bile acid:Na+ symporter
MTELLAKLLPIGLLLLMFVVGLQLRLRDVAGAFVFPGALLLGLAVQVIGLPLAAFALGLAFGLSGPMLAGLVLVAAAPGGVTSNYIALLARADIALSAAMTLVTTVLASVTIPLVLSLTGVAELPGAAGLLRISLAMAAVAIGPMAVGMALAMWRQDFSAALLRWLEPASRVIFIAMVLATFVQNWDAMMQNLATVAPATLLLNLTALGLAGGAAMLFGLSVARRRAIMVEASLQNVAVALFVAGSLLHEPALSVPGLVYAVIMNVSALAQITIARTRA